MSKLLKVDKITPLKEFLSNNLFKLRHTGGEGIIEDFPEYDLFAEDYLEFAEHELQEMKNNSHKLEHIHLINCVSHLRRAIDCQLDTCLYILKINLFKKKNLSIGHKLQFFKEAGVFNSYSLNRFNKVRNKMEHDYRIPNVEDIEVYFDLVSAFVLVLQSMINSLNTTSKIYFTYEELDIETITDFEIYYSFTDVPQITYRILKNERIYEVPNADYRPEEVLVTTTPEEREEFTYFLKILLLFARKDGVGRENYILKHI